MSGSTEVAVPGRLNLAGEKEKALKRSASLANVVRRHYHKKGQVSAEEVRELEGSFTGILSQKSTFLGFSTTEYRAHDVALKQPCESLVDLEALIEDLIASKSLDKSLKKTLRDGLLKEIRQDKRDVEVERNKLFARADEGMHVSSAVISQTAERETELKRQLEAAELYRQRQQAEAQNTINELALEKERLMALLERATNSNSEQSGALLALANMASLETAADMTIHVFQAMESTLDQLSAINTAAQTVRQHKESAILALKTASDSLAELVAEEWMGAQLDAALSQVATVGDTIAAYEAQAITRDRAENQPFMANIVKKTLSDVSRMLGKYEEMIEGQWFRTWRAGYNKKLPEINELKADISNALGRVEDSGNNAHAILQEVRGKILAKKQNHRQELEELYQNGSKYSGRIDKALREIDVIITECVRSPQTVTTERSVNLALVDGINTTEQLVDRLNARYSAVGAQLSRALTTHTDVARTGVTTASTGIAQTSDAIELASRVRADFIDRLKVACKARTSGRSGANAGIDAVSEAMRSAGDVRDRLHRRLIGDVPTAGATVEAASTAITPVMGASSALTLTTTTAEVAVRG